MTLFCTIQATGEKLSHVTLFANLGAILGKILILTEIHINDSLILLPFIAISSINSQPSDQGVMSEKYSQKRNICCGNLTYYHAVSQKIPNQIQFSFLGESKNFQFDQAQPLKNTFRCIETPSGNLSYYHAVSQKIPNQIQFSFLRESENFQFDQAQPLKNESIMSTFLN